MEMIQTSLPLSVAQPTTPPSTPTQPSSEHALNNVPQLTEMIKAIVATEIACTASKCKCPHTPPEASEPTISEAGPNSNGDTPSLFPAPQDELENHYRLMDMVGAIVDLHFESLVSVPQAPTQPLTIHDLKQLLKELIEAKPAGPAQDSEAPQPDTVEDAQVNEVEAEDINAFKTVKEMYATTAK